MVRCDFIEGQEDLEDLENMDDAVLIRAPARTPAKRTTVLCPTPPLCLTVLYSMHCGPGLRWREAMRVRGVIVNRR